MAKQPFRFKRECSINLGLGRAVGFFVVPIASDAANMLPNADIANTEVKYAEDKGAK